MYPVPTFADPKTDFVFKRIFGEAAHKHLLIALLNDLLELEGTSRITDVAYLPVEQRVALPEMKMSVVDVKCVDARGAHYVVEMQLLNVEGFEKRVVYNVCKSYVMQLRKSEKYVTIDDVIGITICDFSLWPNRAKPEGPTIPMLSRWRMQEQHGGAQGLSQVQFVFLELPKYEAGNAPVTVVEKWAYFFREAENLAMVPTSLAQQPFEEAFDVARVGTFTLEEWQAYERGKMAELDARGRYDFATHQGLERGLEQGLERGLERGLEQGRQEGLRFAIEAVCELLTIPLTEERKALLAQLDETSLLVLLTRLRAERRWEP